MPITCRQWVLASRPEGAPETENFRLEEVELADLAPHELLIAARYISVDPGMRSRLTGDSYAAALDIGAVIEGAAVGEVIASNNDKFAVGDLVTGGLGWRSHALSNGRGLAKLDPALFAKPLTLTAAIGVLGIPGLTAYFGLLDLGEPDAGDTVLISSAAGPVGATAGQIAKLRGCKAVGIAGSPRKCAYVTDDLGFDACIDYKAADDLAGAIATACPDGVDIFFDNVGAETLDAAILNMKEHGRIVISGALAEYNRSSPRGIRNTLRFITHRLRMEGLVVFDYFKEFRTAQAEMAGWIRSGQLKYTEDITDGLENAPAAFIGLFEGESLGRRLIRVG